ncbi:hypothetical protein FXO38_19008 [Capsicum annuum]|nr:hypothetical protein FXO38_19008 [Capsicum annuum]
MPNVVNIRSNITKIKKIVAKLYERPVVAEPIVKKVIAIVYMPNIYEVPADALDEETEEQRREKKRKKKEDKASRKRARAESIQDEQDQKTRVLEMAMGVGGSRSSVFDTMRVDVMPQIGVNLVAVDGMVVDESGTQSEGPCADVDALAP